MKRKLSKSESDEIRKYSLDIGEEHFIRRDIPNRKNKIQGSDAFWRKDSFCYF